MVDYEVTNLMPQIQKLISPPVSDEKSSSNATRTKNKHPYFKRHGKGHNHDLCDSCNEGGDLICCDKCPSSFHLTCHDPPLDEEDIPLGEWLCHRCKAMTVKAKRKPSSDDDSDDKSKNMLDILIEAASQSNPVQFQLPKHMIEPCIFPGTDKNERKVSPMEHNNPLSSKCYVCSKTCRAGTLIACDYCSLYFHLDCLDPPLTTPPSDRWMCPNHVQHYLDTRMLTSASATERNRLWAEYANNWVDQDAIKLEFFRRINRKNPPFRYKIRLGKRKRAQVPAIVRHHYTSPVSLLPSLRDVLRLNTVLERRKRWSNGDFEFRANYEPVPHEIKSENVCSTTEHEVASLVENSEQKSESNLTLNDDTIKDLKAANIFLLNDECSKFLGEVLKENEKRQSIKSEDKQDEKVPDPELASLLSKDVMLDEDEEKPKLATIQRVRTYGVNKQEEPKCMESEQKPKCLDFQDVERELQQLDERVLKILALQRIQQILKQQNFEEPFNHRINNIQMPLPSQLLTPADIERIARVFTSPKKKNGSTRNSSNAANVNNLRARAMLCPVVSKYFYNVRNSEGTEVRHDASFMGYRPTVSARFPEAFSMRYRSLTIGRGASNQLQLDMYGHCNNISAKHAVIFYDEHTKQYELLNYSMYGSYVNNVLYCNHIAERPIKPNANRNTELDRNVKEIVDKRRKVLRKCKTVTITDAKMIATDSIVGKECLCVSNLMNRHVSDNCAAADVNSIAGWEGSALLHHGSLVRFGCISFVFSIVTTV